MGFWAGVSEATLSPSSFSGDSAAIPNPKIALPLPKDVLAQLG